MVTLHGILLASEVMDWSYTDHDSCIGNPNRRRVNGIVIFQRGVADRQTRFGFLAVKTPSPVGEIVIRWWRRGVRSWCDRVRGRMPPIHIQHRPPAPASRTDAEVRTRLPLDPS